MNSTSSNVNESFKIVIKNINNEDIVCHSLILLKGQIIRQKKPITVDKYVNNIVLCHYRLNDNNAEKSTWAVRNEEFRCILNLSVGKNDIILQYFSLQCKLTVNFVPRRTLYRVMPVYIVCKDHDGKFQAPTNENNSVESALNRISLGAKLVQCLTAEKLYEAGLGRKTFQLEGELNSQSSPCTIFHSKLSCHDAHKMTAEDLWSYFEHELMTSLLYSKYRKFLAFLSCTQYTSTYKPSNYEDMLSKTKGYVAYGGGSLALFGTACLYTWPSSIEDIIPRFADTTPVSAQFMDDSCYRGTLGGCFATTLGSVLHELAHTFDLGHAAEGIMSRGFDHVNLVFVNQECDNTKRKHVSRPPVVNNNRQHSTVAFSRMLYLTYTVSSPVRRISDKLYSSSSNISSTKTDEKSERRLSVSSATASDNFERNNCNLNSVRIMKDDLTYWDKSSAVLLAYHKWFNTEVENNIPSGLTFDEKRNAICSTLGIRVVEIRDETGFILNTWQFDGADGCNDFIIPREMCKRADKIVAEDTHGNIIYVPVNKN